MTSGVGEQYNNAIQAFVVACIAAYKAGYSLTALRLELSTRELKSTDTNRDISLTEQEKDTRLVWISLVYLTLARFSFKSERTPPDVRDELAGTKFADLASGLFRLVDTVCEAAKKGYNLDSFKLELRLKMDPADKELSGAQSSIRSQWSRIVFATVSILPDSMK